MEGRQERLVLMLAIEMAWFVVLFAYYAHNILGISR
jgi:hypothetical protein